jgi:hypothetical protein
LSSCKRRGGKDEFKACSRKFKVREKKENHYNELVRKLNESLGLVKSITC